MYICIPPVISCLAVFAEKRKESHSENDKNVSDNPQYELHLLFSEDATHLKSSCRLAFQDPSAAFWTTVVDHTVQQH